MKHIKLFKENTKYQSSLAIYKVDIDLIEDIMDTVTSDQYMEDIVPGDRQFYDYHSDICDAHYPSQDWCWEEALEHWSADMVQKAIDAYFVYSDDRNKAEADQLIALMNREIAEKKAK